MLQEKLDENRSSTNLNVVSTAYLSAVDCIGANDENGEGMAVDYSNQIVNNSSNGLMARYAQSKSPVVQV